MALMAGVAQTDITPLLGTALAGQFQHREADDINDPLYAKALVLQEDGISLAILSLDLLYLRRADVQAIRENVAKHTGIPSEHVMVACTHTHTGPATVNIYNDKRDEVYCRWLHSRAADAVRLAAKRLQPALLGTGAGELADHIFCRRYMFKDGRVRTNCGKHPDIVGPSSPVDPKVGVLYVEAADQTPLALVARYSLHYAGTDTRTAVSADYYGHFAAVARQFLGAACLPILLNGNSAQINYINPFAQPLAFGHKLAKRIASALVGEVLQVKAKMRMQDTCVLAVATKPVELPRKALTAEDIETARRIAAANSNMENASFSWTLGAPFPEGLLTQISAEMLALNDLPQSIATEVQVMRIGNSAWVGLPGEIFTEIGMNVMNEAPTSQAFVVELANDSLGYICTDKALLQEGGYETWPQSWSPIGVGAEKVLVDASRSALKQLFAPESSGDEAVEH